MDPSFVHWWEPTTLNRTRWCMRSCGADEQRREGKPSGAFIIYVVAKCFLLANAVRSTCADALVLYDERAIAHDFA